MLSLFQGPPDISWHRAPKKLDTALVVIEEMGACSMCPRPYVSIALCVNSSMCPGFYVANIMPYRPFVSRVLWVQGSLCPWFYVARDEQIDPLCHGTYVAKALCVQGSMWPQSTLYCQAQS